jgi:hypothetical protein
MTHPTTIATPAAAATPLASTRIRLLCGVLAGPLFLLVSYAQALTRDGFDLTRNAFSYLSLGSLGWIQITNFVVCGTLFVVAATGIRRALPAGPGSTWAPRLIATLGAAMITGGMMVIDPSYGYPPGTPAGKPDTLTWHGTLHGIAFTVAVLSWLAACFVFARRFTAARQYGWAGYSAAVALTLLAPIATLIAPPGAPLIYAAGTLGWTWTSTIAARLLHDLPS